MLRRRALPPRGPQLPPPRKECCKPFACLPCTCCAAAQRMWSGCRCWPRTLDRWRISRWVQVDGMHGACNGLGHPCCCCFPSCCFSSCPRTPCSLILCTPPSVR